MRTKLTFLTTFLLLLLALPSYLRAEPATTNLAGVVVDLGGGQVQTYCIAFAEEQISGFVALQRTGLPIAVDVSGMGAAVCQIGQTGCPSTNCFCQCPGGSTCNYWSYWHLASGNWQYAQGGASTYMVRHGMVDGWVWGAGGSGNASPPVSTSFEQVCAAQLPATATPTSVPTATPLPTATATPTVLPTSTAAPVVQFSAVAPAIASGVCTELVWDVQHVQAIYLDGVGVSGQGRQQVCPSQTAVYQLRVVHATGEQVAQVTVNVTAATSTPLATAAPASVAPAGVAAVPTAVPTELPINPTETAPLTVETLPAETPSPQATELSPTREIIMVQVPLANTATPLPLEGVEVAQVLPTAEALPTAVPVSPPPSFSAEPAPPPFDWLGYGVFALLATILGIMLFFVRR
jgi:hypothetical protein